MFLQFIIIFWLKHTYSEITNDHSFIYNKGYNHYQLFHIICKLDDDNYFVGTDTKRDKVAFKLNNTDCRTFDSDGCFFGSTITIDCYTNHLKKILDSDHRPLIDKVKNKLSYNIIETISNDCPNMCKNVNRPIDVINLLIIASAGPVLFMICCIYQKIINKTL